MRTPGAYSTRRPVEDLRQQAWNSIRVLRVFTTAQIEATAQITRGNLRKYLRALKQAGYVRIVQPKQNGKSRGHAVWRLVRNSGPRAPIVRRDGSGVYDPNQERLYPYPAATETSPVEAEWVDEP